MRTVYRASRVHTLSHPSTGEWILVDDRHVQRVGTGDPPEADRIVELPGATIIPGFVDSHVHLTGTGIHLQAPDLGTATSAEALMRIVGRVVENRDGPVLVHGYDESTWPVRALPTLADLDAISDVPLAVVRVDGHLTLANSRALKESGVLERNGLEVDEMGQATGKVTLEANASLRRWFSTHLAEGDENHRRSDAFASREIGRAHV